MNYYQEIKLLPDLEVGVYFLWQKIFLQIHLALVALKDSNDKVPVGISFPEYNEGNDENTPLIGSVIRIFGESDKILAKLNIKQALRRFCDYVYISEVRAVTNPKGYATFVRWSGDQNPERLARRRAKRHNISFEEAMAYYRNFKPKNTPPYIQMKSLSGERDFRLYIKKNIVEKPVEGKFSTYGLGVQKEAVATVPIF